MPHIGMRGNAGTTSTGPARQQRTGDGRPAKALFLARPLAV